MLDLMRTATFTIVGTSPLSFSRFHGQPKLSTKETEAGYDERLWREKLHYDDDASSKNYLQCYIKPDALKQSIEGAASYLQTKVPGKGQSTFKARFLGGVCIHHGIYLYRDGSPITRDGEMIKRNIIFANADGVRGGGKRVMRSLPLITLPWSATVVMDVYDSDISDAVLLNHLRAAGVYKGIGQYRPEKGGYCGRFIIEDLQVK